MAEKKVNYGVQGLEDLVADINGNDEQSGPIDMPTKPASEYQKKKAKMKEVTSICISAEMMGKLRFFSMNTGRKFSDIIEESLSRYFASYERKGEKISIPDIYKKRLGK